MSSKTDEQALERGFNLHTSGRHEEAERIYREVLVRNPAHPVGLHLLGVLLFQLNQLQPAEELIASAIAADGGCADFHNSLGMVLTARSEFFRAIDALERALELRPRDVKAHFGLANALYEAGRAEAAVVAYRRTLWLDPEHAEARNNLGNALLAAGRLDEAVDAFQQVLHEQPDHAPAHYNLGTVFQQMSRLDDAETEYRIAIGLQPHLLEAHNNLGLVLQGQGRIDGAIQCFRAALAIDAQSTSAHNNLGITLLSLGRFEEAAESFRAALATGLRCVEACNNLATALHKLGRPAEAIDAYRQALTLRPDSAPIFNNFGNLLKEVGWLDEAIACFDRAITLNGEDPDYFQNAGNALMEAGQLHAAVAAFRHALSLRPDSAIAHSALLYALQFQWDQNPEALWAEHRQWNQQHALPLAALARPHGNDPSPGRRLRIGYISPDFRNHVIGRFMRPLLAGHDPGRFEILCYSDVSRPDAMTERLRKHAHGWHHVMGMSDEALAERVRGDGVDILVDLTMHMGGSRLLVFARKPAPVQVTYLAYPGTTGLEAMDYRLTDPRLDPPGQADEGRYSERSVRLPHTYWCYQPPDDAPEVGPLPAREAGEITFGCLNNFCKVSEPAAQAWARILAALPRSRLLLHACEGTHRQRFCDRMERLGIDPARIEFAGFLPTPQYLAQYNRIDIVLDPFPCVGGTTTCDALWMGAPVVSLAGQTGVSRGGRSLLTTIGLPQLIAEDVDQYVRVAVDLAQDPEMLATLRSGLRRRMLESPLMDAAGFARDVEAAYRRMWEAWCQTRAGQG